MVVFEGLNPLDAYYLMITGYPGEEKVRSIVTELRNDEGFRNPGETTFNLLPHRQDPVSSGALVKYRGTTLLERVEP